MDNQLKTEKGLLPVIIKLKRKKKNMITILPWFDSIIATREREGFSCNNTLAAVDNTNKNVIIKKHHELIVTLLKNKSFFH